MALTHHAVLIAPLGFEQPRPGGAKGGGEVPRLAAVVGRYAAIDNAYFPAFVGLYDFGLNVTQVARVFGVSPARVTSLFKRHGVHGRRYKQKPARAHDGRRKLTDDQVLTIRALVRDHVATQREMAKRFGISTAAIHHIVTGRNYRHLKGGLNVDS